MPFPSIAPSDIAALAEDKVFYNRQQEGKKEELPVTDTVAALERKCNTLQELCGEILSTLQLEGNVHLFKDFPQDWTILVQNWRERYEKETVS